MTLMLTREQILEMPAGPELDRLVAARLMSFVYVNGDDGKPYSVLCTPDYAARWCAKFPDASAAAAPPPGVQAVYTGMAYSTDIAAAWLVAETLKGHGGGVNLWITNRFAEAWVSVPAFAARAETAPLAICRAALLAVVDGAD